MREVKFLNNHQDLNDLDLGQIAGQIKEGYSSGHLSNWEGKKIYWELKVNVWEEE